MCFKTVDRLEAERSCKCNLMLEWFGKTEAVYVSYSKSRKLLLRKQFEEYLEDIRIIVIEILFE